MPIGRRNENIVFCPVILYRKGRQITSTSEYQPFQLLFERSEFLIDTKYIPPKKSVRVCVCVCSTNLGFSVGYATNLGFSMYLVSAGRNHIM